MRQLGIAFIATFILTALASPIPAQESPTPLTGGEIKSQILGHKFRGHYRPSDEDRRMDTLVYFSADDKFVLQIDQSSNPIAIYFGTYELKDDKLCLQETGAMQNAALDRCYKAYGINQDGRWSGTFIDTQDSEIGIPLDSQYDLETGELEPLWSNWDSLRKDAGPIDAFGSMEEISINPFRFKGKNFLVRGGFKQMIGDGRAWFRPREYTKDMIVEGLPNDLFHDADQMAILIGEFTGTFRMTIEGSDAFLPVMALKAARICKDSKCGDYFDRWQ